MQARRKRRRLPVDGAARVEHYIAPNHLQRLFEAEAPNRKWVADFICLDDRRLAIRRCHNGLYSRRIVGWLMSDTMQARMVNDALLMALWRRGEPTDLMFHSDSKNVGAGCFRAA